MPILVGQMLSDFAFWRSNAGVWQGENTYFDGDLNYNIRSYNRLTIVTIDGRTFTETEHKFYAPSTLAQRFGEGAISAGQGIEVIARFTGQMSDQQGTVEIADEGQPLALPGLRPYVSVLNADTAVRVTPGAGSSDAYRMFITLPAPNKRYCVNLGLFHEPAGAANLGDLRSFAVFRENRIGQADFESVRRMLRTKNSVAAMRDNDAAGKTRISTLGAD